MLGAGAVYPRAADAFERGIIYMAHARGGYVGATVAEGGQLVAGAALRPGFVRKHGIAGGVERVLAAAGRPAFSAVDGVVWRGTPLLTRSPRRPYDGRTLFAGDTAGYVEPFTGEGIGWAMRSGLAVADLAAAGWSPGLGERWAVRRDELLRPAQARCRTLSTALRWPGAVSLAVRTLRLFPSIAPRLVQKTTAWASPS